MRECSVCLGICDPEIHAATLRIHAWFRSQVTMSLDKEVPVGKRVVVEEEVCPTA